MASILTTASVLLCFSTSVLADAAAHGGGSTQAQASTGGGGGGGGHHSNTLTPADELNRSLVLDMYITWSSIIIALAIFTVVLFSSRYMRLIAAVGTNQQAFFQLRNPTWGNIKRHLLDAPLFSKRHHREFKLSSAVNMGTLPSRFQMLFLLGYFFFQMLFCFYNIEWDMGRNEMLSQLISRTGILAVLNMLPLFLLAGRNNPLIPLCGITFDTFNLIHRWIGRICIIQALIHTIAWMVKKVLNEGWPAVQASLTKSMFIIAGTVAMAGFLWMLIASVSPIRHAFYETFLHLHILVAAMVLGAMWYHMVNRHWLRNILLGVMIIWAGERSIRFFRIIYRNFGNGGTRTTVEVLPGDACRVTVQLARPWTFRPGQHAYLYIPSIGFWTSHPFTVAWSEEEVIGVSDKASGSTSSSSSYDEKVLPVSNSEIHPVRATTFSFICRKRTGFTDKLYRRAERNPTGVFQTWGVVEGPYGSQDLRSFGTVLLVAAGVGITHQVPHVRELVLAYGNGACATRRVTLVWIIQSPEHLEWIRKWMTTILALPKRREVLRILLYITRPKSNREIRSPSSSVQMMPGRPDLRRLVAAEVDAAVGAVGVSCCGVGELADEVRSACRPHMSDRSVTFMEESFSW